MTERVIPIAEARYQASVPDVSVAPKLSAAGELLDQRARRLHDLRISVTDRCNFRCTYCMPKSVFDKDYQFLPQASLLRFEEIERLARIFIDFGVEKLRLTGGEPLLRKNLDELIERLARLSTRDGRALDLTLTTNGSLLARKARALRQAGLKRLTVSLDAVDDATFRAMNDVDFAVADVLAGVDAAASAGFSNIKINMVVKRSVNADQILPMARRFKASGHIVRFIEFMDVGASNGWDMTEVVPSREVIELISREMPLMPIDPNYPGEVAERWRYQDNEGEIGVISSVTQAFCSNCTRARLSTEGRLYTCLFAQDGYDLRSLLRGPYSDEQIRNAIGAVWQARNDRYSEVRTAASAAARKIEMSYIGG